MKQTLDQTGKGAIAALVIYALNRSGLHTDAVLVLAPVIIGLLAWMSKKVGDPTIASFLSDTTEDE